MEDEKPKSKSEWLRFLLEHGTEAGNRMDVDEPLLVMPDYMIRPPPKEEQH